MQAAATAHEPRSAAGPSPVPSSRRGRARHGVVLAAGAAALVPIAVAAARALLRGWLPVGDNALFAIRARDVFTDHIPLIGTWSSASLDAGTELNHPGPLMFDWLAVPVRLVPGGGGVAIGVALLNAAAVVGMVVAASRRGGAVPGTAAAAVAAALCWSMGSEILFEPWNPHSVLLPFLCFVILAWGLACGDAVLLPWAVAVGSLVVQTHLSYAVLVPVLGAWGVAGLLIELRRRRRDAGASRDHPARSARRVAVVASVVAVACWAQPVVEQLTAEGEGNLTRLLSSGTDAPAAGYRTGVRLVADVVALPPWWVRPSFSRAWTAIPARSGLPAEGVQLPGVSAAGAALALVAVLLLLLGWGARRRGDRTALLGLGTAGVLVATALLTAGRAPSSRFGLAPHQFRWLWPTAAFVTFAVLVALLRGPGRRLAAGSTSVALAALTGLLAVVNLPTSDQGTGAQPYAIDVVDDLNDQLGRVEGQGPVVVDDLFTTFADPYGTAVLAELQRRGIAFVTANPALLRQLGPDRRFDGTNARASLLMRTGTADPPPGARQVARHAGLSGSESRERRRLEARVRSDLSDRRVLPLTSEGAAAVDDGRFPVLGRQLQEQRLDPDELLASRELVTAARRGYIAFDGSRRARLERYADLQARADEQTVALFIAPL